MVYEITTEWELTFFESFIWRAHYFVSYLILDYRKEDEKIFVVLQVSSTSLEDIYSFGLSVGAELTRYMKQQKK
jgi:hypothetical protein